MKAECAIMNDVLKAAKSEECHSFKNPVSFVQGRLRGGKSSP